MAEPDFSLTALINWLEKQNPHKRYESTDADVCILAQWLGDTCCDYGGGAPNEEDSFCYLVNGQPRSFNEFEEIVLGGTSTFGEALKRARSAQTTD